MPEFPKNKKQKKLSSLDYFKTSFLEYCEVEKGKSQRTISNYDHYLTRFILWAKANYNIQKPEEITLDMVRKYRLWLNRLKGKDGSLKKVTQNYHIIALRAWLKYLARHDIKTLPAEKIELSKTPVRVVEFLSEEELEKLFSKPNIKSLKGLRDRAILEVLFSTGLRISELVSLNRNQVSPSRDEFTVRGKGDKPRLVFLSDKAKFWLKRYLQKRTDNLLPLFINHSKKKEDIQNPNSQRLTARSIQRMIKKYALLSGLTKKVTPHTLRHSFATDLLSNNANIRSVQAMLGHASLSTTQIYTHVTNQELKKIHKACHGRKRR
jgi:site-specific recombinase XerD